MKKEKPLGQGAFGEVFRGFLQPNAMEKVSRRKSIMGRDSNLSMACVVAIKMLKGLTY